MKKVLLGIVFISLFTLCFGQTMQGPIRTKNIEGQRFANEFPTNQAACTDAGTTGSVIIPNGTSNSDVCANSNNILIWDQKKSTYANLLKFYSYGLALNSGATLNIFGDSLACGQGATTPSTQGFAYLIASSFGYVPNQQCTTGTQAQDAGQIDKIYATPITQTSITLWQPAFNDMRLNGTGGQPLLTAKNTIMAGAIHAAIPDAFRIAGSAAGCVKTGTWATNTGVYSNLPVFSTTNGDTVTCHVRGNYIYVTLLAATGGGGAATIDVDGTFYGGTFNLFGYATSQLSRAYSPFPVIIRVPGTGDHAVTVHVASATNVSNSVNLVEVAGNAGGSDYAGPHFYLGEVLHMTATGYAAGAPYNVGSDAAVDAYNASLEDVCRQLGKEGHLGVVCVGTSRYNPTLYVSADNIHPSTAGHQVTADEFICRMSGTTCSTEKAASTATGYTTYLPIYSALPGNFGMFFNCPDATDCQIAANRDPGTGINLNPSVFGGAINFGSDGTITFYTTGSGVTGSATQAFKITPAGKFSTPSQLVSTLATGTPPLSIASATPVTTMVVANHPQLSACTALANNGSCPAFSAITAAKEVFGDVVLAAGTSTVNNLPFTSASSYRCTLTDQTALNLAKPTYTSGSVLTITGTTTDVITFMCKGS
jgi:hypothetical protein